MMNSNNNQQVQSSRLKKSLLISCLAFLQTSMCLAADAVPPQKQSKAKTVLITGDDSCAPNDYDLFGMKLGSTVETIQKRKDCSFRSVFRAKVGFRSYGYVGSSSLQNTSPSAEQEVTLIATAAPRSNFSGQSPVDFDITKLRLYGQAPDIVYCYFQKENPTDSRLLNEIFVSFYPPNIDTNEEAIISKILLGLRTKYGLAKRTVYPNQTVEYQWKNAAAVLSLYVLPNAIRINLMTPEKYAKLGPPGSFDSALPIMAESEKKVEAELRKRINQHEAKPIRGLDP